MADESVSAVPKVYAAIAKVTAEIAKVGIAKDRKAMGYAFRGIDQVYDALAKILPSCGLVILPRVLGSRTTEKTTGKGSVLAYTYIKVAYDLVSTEDGSQHTIVVLGEAMDSGDKASSKAMSIAFKYACFQAFCIPLEGNDAESETHTDILPAPDQLRAQLGACARRVGKDVAKARLSPLLKESGLAELADIASIDSSELLSKMLNALNESK